jgi:hypothetical protein
MSTTTELPNPNLEQKMDMLIELVNSFRSSLMEQYNKLEEDSRTCYVDLRQRIEALNERQTRMEEKFDRQERYLAFIAERMEHLDIKFDVFVKEFSFLKDRVRELEVTRPLH